MIILEYICTGESVYTVKSCILQEGISFPSLGGREAQHLHVLLWNGQFWKQLCNVSLKSSLQSTHSISHACSHKHVRTHTGKCARNKLKTLVMGWTGGLWSMWLQ